MNTGLVHDFSEEDHPKVSRIIRMAYFAERMDCWYCSTGILKFTPKLEFSISLMFEVL